MSSWGNQRRTKIIFVFFLIVAIIIVVILFSLTRVDPTCFDGKDNNGEFGVDCGGPCLLLCENQTITPIINWVRYFEIIPGFYNTVAMIENKNVDAEAKNVGYRFELYDQHNALIAKRTGTINIRPKEIIPIVEHNVNTGKLKATRVAFFLEDTIWTKSDIKERVLIIKNEQDYEVDGLPRISAVLFNSSFYPVKDISVIVVAYDDENNAITTSSTVVDIINPNSSKDLIFTWPNKLEKDIASFEIIPLYEFNS